MAALGAGSAGVSQLGFACARSCGWCIGLMDMLVAEHVAQPLCRSRTAASCAHTAGAADPGNAACAAVDIVVQPLPFLASAACLAVTGCVYTHGHNLPRGCVAHINDFAGKELTTLFALVNPPGASTAAAPPPTRQHGPHTRSFAPGRPRAIAD